MLSEGEQLRHCVLLFVLRLALIKKIIIICKMCYKFQDNLPKAIRNITFRHNFYELIQIMQSVIQYNVIKK